MPDVTDEELRKEIEKILKNADLGKTSTNKVIQKLEKVFDVKLADRKKTIDQMVLDYVNSQESDDDDKDDDDDDDEEDEEEVKKPAKRAASNNKSAKKPRKKRAKNSDDSEDEDYESNDSEYEEKKPKRQAAKGKKAGAKGGGRGKGSGYTRAYKLSPALAELMGADEMPRHEVVKRMWAIIKEKELYDPNNKQFAICDDALYKVIGTKRFRTFGMMKYLKTHFLDE
ncbi:uncharacterized protein LOC135083848 [Ostrinia nubilalis]|uniref:upstream activation factor subunit spp27 n=1 Tax=Ostrinia furnacalis TaxID=93504 RepID=UPI00103AA8D8|nr:upstream activation factor subunit spp27 [Ostrinia furnacalis]